jgi:predicted double-glycine peptidase
MIIMASDFPCCPVYERGETPDPGTVILSSVPDVTQSTRYSCGPSCLQAVLRYWGICVQESDLMDRLHTTPERGTDPGQILSLASSYGFSVTFSENLTILDLKQSVESRIPVIVIVQAWNGYEQDGIWVPVAPDRWEDVWNAGHYLVVIGVDSRNLYFEDPALLGTRGVIPVHEFPDRWHYRRKGTGPGDPDRDYIHPGIRIAGESPAPSSRYTRIT